MTYEISMMNYFKRIPHRTSWCELKRLQSSLSQLNSMVQIPTKIKRGPTDILHALECTIPNDSTKLDYIYHDDPFLQPLRKISYREYALSYEAGKKAAMWIHNEHTDLFPKHLSNPEIEAFKPPIIYNDKSQVSEEILLQSISQGKLADAFHIYKLLESNVSNEAKQALLELVCFYNDHSNITSDLPFERWFITPKHKLVWKYNPDINELYKFLITQDSKTAAAAYNTMLCSFSRFKRFDEAWLVFKECQQKNIPLNVTTCNYVLLLISYSYTTEPKEKIKHMLNILKSMNNEGIKPNIRTLNATLKIISTVQGNIDKNLIKHLLKEFKNINIKFSLATYYYILITLLNKDSLLHTDFIDIITTVKNESFTIQDPEDNKFFGLVMYLASHYADKNAGDMIHELLFKGNNFKFISDSIIENNYYAAYISLLLKTTTYEEFFNHYKKIVPSKYVPSKNVFNNILRELEHHSPTTLMKYISVLWSDLNTIYPSELLLKLNLIRLIRIDLLPLDSPLRTEFVDIAWKLWNDIKEITKKNPGTYTPVENTMLSCIPIILLHGDRLKESIEVLITIVKRSDLFLPTMTEKQGNELFETCISKQCIAGAFLILEYSVNVGFKNIVEMSKQLYNLSQHTNEYRNKLINLVGIEIVDSLDTSKSS